MVDMSCKLEMHSNASEDRQGIPLGPFVVVLTHVADEDESQNVARHS